MKNKKKAVTAERIFNFKNLRELFESAEKNDGNVNYAVVWKFMFKNNITREKLAKKCGLSLQEMSAILTNNTNDNALIIKLAHYMKIPPELLKRNPPE